MSKISVAGAAGVLLAVLSLTAAAQQPQSSTSTTVPDGKVVFINTAAFPSEIGELKQKYEQVETQFKDRVQRVRSMEESLKQKETDLNTKAPSLTPEKYRELQIDYEETKRRLTRDVEDLRDDSQKALDATTRPVRDKLFQFLQNYATQRGIVVVLDIQSMAQVGVIAYVDPATDITNDFIREYNKANPVPGTQPSASANPSSRPR